jgi:hypothetical protein
MESDRAGLPAAGCGIRIPSSGQMKDIRTSISCKEKNLEMSLLDVNDRQLPASTMSVGWNPDTYANRVLKRLLELPPGHPDKGKFTLEHARLRCGNTSMRQTHLRDLTEPFESPNH